MSTPMTEIPRMTPDEINTLARRVVTNEVYIANTDQAYRNAWPLLLAFMAEDLANIADDVGAMWEELSKAGPRSINGFPFFTSGHFVHRDDLDAVLAAIEAKEEALK